MGGYEVNLTVYCLESLLVTPVSIGGLYFLIVAPNFWRGLL